MHMYMCVCVYMYIYIHILYIYIYISVCVNLLNLDSYVYSAWKKCLCEKQQSFVFLNASFIRNHESYVYNVDFKTQSTCCKFQHKRTIHHWEQEYPIDADALWKKCYTYYWKTHILRDTSLPFIKFLCSSDMKTISLYYSKWRVIFDFFVLLLKNISLLWLHRTFLIEQIRQLWTSLVEITEHVYNPNNFWKIFAFDIIDRW